MGGNTNGPDGVPWGVLDAGLAILAPPPGCGPLCGEGSDRQSAAGL